MSSWPHYTKLLPLCFIAFLSFLISVSAHPAKSHEDHIVLFSDLEQRLGNDENKSPSPDLKKRQSNINQYYTYAVDTPAASQQAMIQAKEEAGYRIISLSVYGNPANPLYSTVWSSRPTVPAYSTVFTNSTTVFENWLYYSEGRNGLRVTIISATGPSSSPQIAAVAEELPAGTFTQMEYDLTDGDVNTPGTFEYVNAQLGNSKMVLKSISIYGGPNDRRYAAIWQSNPYLVQTNCTLETSAANFQQTVTTQTLNPGFRLAHVSIDTDQTYTALFSNDRLASSVPWQQQSGLTHTGLIQAIQTGSASGLAPIRISGGGGSGSNTNIIYAVILAPTDIVDTRVMMPPVGSIDSSGFQYTDAAEVIHNIVQGYMQKYAGKISMNTLVFGTLGYNVGTSNAPIDIQYTEITVEDCLNHVAGWNTATYDPTYEMRSIALAQRTDGGPATTQNVVDYMVKNKPLDFPPGQQYVYSNFGYLVLSFLVEKVTGVGYWTWVSQNVLTPNGVNNAEISEWPTAESPRPAGEITQEDVNQGLSALNPTSALPVPWVYGGDGMIKEVDTGAADVTCSMEVLSQFITTNAVWGAGGRTVSSRYGSTGGAWTWAESRSDGVDWTLAFNTRDWWYPEYTGPDSSNDYTPTNLTYQIDQAINSMNILPAPKKGIGWSG